MKTSLRHSANIVSREFAARTADTRGARITYVHNAHIRSSMPSDERGWLNTSNILLTEGGNHPGAGNAPQEATKADASATQQNAKQRCKEWKLWVEAVGEAFCSAVVREVKNTTPIYIGFVCVVYLRSVVQYNFVLQCLDNIEMCGWIKMKFDVCK